MYLYSETVEVLVWNFNKKNVSILRGIYKLKVPWDVFTHIKKCWCIGVQSS